MLKPAITLLVVILVTAAGASAQEPQSTAKPAEPQASRASAQGTNVRIELTITDQRSDAQTPPKTVMLLVEDNQNGRIRTGRGNAVLNLDVRPQIVRDGRVRVLVSLEYTPQDAPDRPSQPPIQESIVALLDDGRALVVSQSADPISDRKVRLEVKATIVK
jgi:hypothetical protein